MKSAMPILFAALSSCAHANDSKVVHPPTASRPLRVLAIGNSYTQSLEPELPKVAEAAGVDLDLAVFAIGGKTLKNHCESCEAALQCPSVKPYRVRGRGATNLPEMLDDGEWDVIALQEHSEGGMHPASFDPWADRLVAFIRERQPKARLFFQLTWADPAFSPRISNGRGGLGSLKMTQDEMADALERTYAAQAERLGLGLIPVGSALQLYRKRLPVTVEPFPPEYVAGLKEGELPDIKGELSGWYEWSEGAPRSKDDGVCKLRMDHHHLNREGKYLQACVWIAALMGKDISELSYVPDFGDDFKRRAPLIRRCAMDAVQNRSGTRRRDRTTIRIDPGVAVGPVKPVNGVGQPPMFGALGDWPMFHYLAEAGIPYSRLHDVGGWLGGGLFVDIPNLFPDFGADETDPANYRFAYTDSLVSALLANGVEPFFRLGVTIENFVENGYPRVNTAPPPDFAKWARICEHVVAHYNEGWAGGMHAGIRYWEIWNEPDNHPDDALNLMFGGPFSEYMRLYGVAATHLKKRFPDLKIGGYGNCGFYAGVGSDHVPGANSSPRKEYFLECSHRFLAAARDNGWPLDFLSFHSYSRPAEILRQVRFADEHLNEYGFTRDRCERILDEWLVWLGRNNKGSALQAAGVAAVLISLQNGPCDLACIYDARCDVGNYSPLFDPSTLAPRKAYYAFTAFNELRRRGTAVKCECLAPAGALCDGPRPVALYAAAARGEDGSVAVMLANDSDESAPFTLDLVGGDVTSEGGTVRRPSCRLTDGDRTDESVPMPSEMPPHSFLVATLPWH